MVRANNAESNQMSDIVTIRSSSSLLLALNTGQKGVFAERYDTTVKLTFDLLV